jgi:hypothetical protein
MDSWQENNRPQHHQLTKPMAVNDEELEAHVNNVDVSSLMTVQGRLDALALIAIQGMRGVYNQKMAVKSGLPVEVLEHDLASAVRAITQIHLISKDDTENNSTYHLTVITE